MCGIAGELRLTAGERASGERVRAMCDVIVHRGPDSHGEYAHGTRWELHRAFRHPQPGCPRFCAIYEADAAATQANRQRRSNPTPQPGERPLSSGPPTWEKHDTLWRLVYRRIES